MNTDQRIDELLWGIKECRIYYGKCDSTSGYCENCISNFKREAIKSFLLQAVKEGKICVDPPTEDEVFEIIDDGDCQVSEKQAKELAKAISSRLRGER